MIEKTETAHQKHHKSGAKELATEQLRWNCPEDIFDFNKTDEIEPLDKIIGQPRALEAIRLGAELFAKGYNIFVTGLSGTGRLSTVRRILEEVTTTSPMTYDYCYVNNFTDQDSPRLICLPKAKGKEFSNSVKDSIEFLKGRLPKLFEEVTFANSRKKIIEEYQNKEREILTEFDDRIKPAGFVRGQLENEQGAILPEVFPIIDNNPVHVSALDDLVKEGKITKEKQEELLSSYQKFHEEIFDIARKGMKIMQEFRKALAENDKASATMVVSSIFNEIKEKYENDKVNIYIDEVVNYILDNLQIFVPLVNQLNPTEVSEPENKENDKFSVFRVNIILDNSETCSAPVVEETNPTFTNLVGTIERTFDSHGYWRTDFTKIKAGSILKADRGYLIVNAQDLFSESGAWNALKRVLLYEKLEIQPYEALFQLSQLHLKPEPIDVQVKVIVIGGQTLYRMLNFYEKGFKKIFKINAQFDYEIERSEEILEQYAGFISKICREEGFQHCTPDGVAAIIEWAVEQSGSQKRITLKFSDVADILREAAFYDIGSSQQYINRSDVEKAIQMRRHRNNLLDEKLSKSILEGVLLIDTKGKRIGQINGLTVIDTGTLSFGKPARITVSIGIGTSGIINVEREVAMSGSIHNKGVLILTGFLRERFAQKKPMTVSASIAFEQSYSEIDGDSATAAEIYCLLSAIAQAPINQSYAITGSVNQKGDIQPIGGVNEKILGFFEICQTRGFVENQGVIIPAQNEPDLMLPKEIIEAVEQGKFKIYSISKIEEAVELLMNLPAGEIDKNGNYPKHTLFGKVQARLELLRKALKDAPKRQSRGKKSEKK